MKYEQDIEKLLADVPVPTVVPGPHRARLKCELLSQASRKETKMPLFKTMLSTPKRRVAFACCAALILVATAWGAEKLYRTIYQTIEDVESAAVAGRDSEAAALTDPRTAVAQQLDDFRELAKINPEGFKVVSIYANDSAALAITTEVVGDHDRQGPLVMTLIKRDGTWLLNDVDLETAATVKDELDRFLERYPDAVEIPVK